MRNVKKQAFRAMIALALTAFVLNSVLATPEFITQAQNTIDEFNNFQAELKSTKGGRPVACKISSSLKTINSASDFPPELCTKRIRLSIVKLNKAISLLNKKTCQGSK